MCCRQLDPPGVVRHTRRMRFLFATLMLALGLAAADAPKPNIILINCDDLGYADIGPFGVKFSQLHAIDLADIDGDGLLDIITGKRFWAHGPKGDQEPGAPAVLYWFELTRKGGKAEYIPHQIDDNSGVGTQVAAGDVNGDGLLDIVVGNKKGAFVHLHSVKKVGKKQWQAAQPKRIH